MALSEKEQEILDKLSKKAKEPDAPPVSKSISATVDLSNEKSVAAAIKHGFLTADEVEDLKEEEAAEKKEKKGDATPRRRGYFKEPDGEE